MIALLFSLLLAGSISSSAMWSLHEPLDRPKDQFDLRLPSTAGQPLSQSLRIEPQSEIKFHHIVRQAYDYSCGSAALVTLLNHDLGMSVTEQQAMEGMLAYGEKEKIIERRGFSLLDMKRYAASFGVQSAGFRGEMSDLQTLVGPAIVPIDYAGAKHFVVLRGVRDGLVYIADPSAGKLVFSQREFAALWDNNTLFVVYPPKDALVPHELALSDRELGVIDMDLGKSRAMLEPRGNSLQMERLINGYGGLSILHR